MGGDHVIDWEVPASFTGSPPHGRGPPWLVLALDEMAGLTPAWAGTTSPSTTRPSSRWAHPRMGGDHSLGSSTRPSPSGSPPHGRGPPTITPDRTSGRGLTPAWAGTTGLGTVAAAFVRGSPPHGRGPPRISRWRRRIVGLTPAWAGTTATFSGEPPTTGAHPRMGGDHPLSVRTCITRLGSPPHGRGPRPAGAAGLRRGGLTPAWAGTTATA